MAKIENSNNMRKSPINFGKCKKHDSKQARRFLQKKIFEKPEIGMLQVVMLNFTLHGSCYPSTQLLACYFTCQIYYIYYESFIRPK